MVYKHLPCQDHWQERTPLPPGPDQTLSWIVIHRDLFGKGQRPEVRGMDLFSPLSRGSHEGVGCLTSQPKSQPREHPRPRRRRGGLKDKWHRRLGQGSEFRSH